MELTDPLAWSAEQPYAGSEAKAIAAGLVPCRRSSGP